MLIDFDLGGRVEVSHLFVRLISELTLDEMTLISRFPSFKVQDYDTGALSYTWISHVLSAISSLPSCVGGEGTPERMSRCVNGFYSGESD